MVGESTPCRIELNSTHNTHGQSVEPVGGKLLRGTRLDSRTEGICETSRMELLGKGAKDIYLLVV